jgi:ABC-type transport system involved in cytochrome c biogenesis permease subunit
MQGLIPRNKIISFISAFVALVFLAIASSPLTGKEALLPVPSLRSSWLLLHVSFSFIGEAFFVISFAAALAGLFAKTEEKRLNYDRITYTSIAVGYPVFTAGALIFGAIWAQKAWGIWWSWDPKETWALITWLVYTGYLHLRLITKKTGRLISLIAVIGFLCTVFTLFGVNYLLPGLHSYK